MRVWAVVVLALVLGCAKPEPEPEYVRVYYPDKAPIDVVYLPSGTRFTTPDGEVVELAGTG